MDLKDWHKRLELEAKSVKRTQERAVALPKPFPTKPTRSVPEPPRKGRGPRKEESREELIARLLDPTLTLDETARLLEVCPTTIRRWTNKGVLPCERSAGNQRRFKLSSIQTFLRSREGSASAEE